VLRHMALTMHWAVHWLVDASEAGSRTCPRHWMHEKRLHAPVMTPWMQTCELST
jgi:hypothetical protein